MGKRADTVTFLNLWASPEQKGWNPVVREAIDGGNTALIALGELAQDLRAGGFLEVKKSLRHAATHRFMVLHNPLLGGFRETPSVEHHEEGEFCKEVFETLRICRAAILYFWELVYRREHRQSARGPNIPIELPPYSANRLRGQPG